MPSLQPIKILGNLTFLAHAFPLPEVWKQPAGPVLGDQFNRAFTKAEVTVTPKLIPPWFLPAIPGNKYSQGPCDDIGQQFKDFHDTMCDAVVFAHDLWRLAARFSGLEINAVTALGEPGCLKGPKLESLIKMHPGAAKMTGNMAKHRDAVAKGISTAFASWQDNVTVPGLPWYPAFAAFPGPQAPPMPNIPMPLITCISEKMTDIILPFKMRDEMGGGLVGALKEKHTDKHWDGLYDALSVVFSLAFLMWLPMQMVMLVLGKGPIPTFAPPYVPVGPVVMGDNLAIPGHLIT